MNEEKYHDIITSILDNDRGNIYDGEVMSAVKDYTSMSILKNYGGYSPYTQFVPYKT